jgi:hypothetical protein
MVMDYLLIQAMLVPCKCVFSSAKQTDTLNQNQISPVLMEALQLLKFLLKKEHLNFINGWSTLEVVMSKAVTRGVKPTQDLGLLFKGNPDNVMDNMLNELSTYDHEC